MSITPELMRENWEEYRNRMNLFPNRKDQLLRMCDDLEERFVFDPASSYDYFHNAFPGGYCDHVLRVHDNAILQYELWKNVGFEFTFTEEELHFAALHHDLGKLGMPGNGNGHYLQNDSEWHVKNQGKIYKTNPNIQKMSTADRSFYLLNHYKIPYSLEEMLGIKLTDGMYDENNKDYLAGFNLDSKLRSNLPYILHHADIMAFRFEFERWAKETGKFRLGENSVAEVVQVKSIPKSGRKEIDLDLFDQMFKV